MGVYQTGDHSATATVDELVSIIWQLVASAENAIDSIVGELDSIELNRYCWYDFPDYWDLLDRIEDNAKKEGIDVRNYVDDENGNRSPFVMHQMAPLIASQYGFALQIGTIDLRCWKDAETSESDQFPRYFILRKQGEQVHFHLLPSLENAWLKEADWADAQTLKLTFTYHIPNPEKGKNKKKHQKMFITVDQNGIRED